jgi:hypothetical protein
MSDSDRTVRQQWIAGLIRNFWTIVSAEIGWLACIMGAAQGRPWLGLVVVPGLFVIHITVIERHKIYPIFMVAMASITIGFFTDTALILLGAVEPNRWWIPWPFTTLWDLMIWAGFSLTLNTSLRFLQKKPLTAAIFGALIAPGTYYAGGQLGALQFAEPVFVNLVWIGAVWFFSMPCLSLTAGYFHQSRGTETV